VWITTCQFAKCEWNSGLASKNNNQLASLASFFSLSLILPPPDPKLFSDLVSEHP
jgi:hypothetical protein